MHDSFFAQGILWVDNLSETIMTKALEGKHMKS